MNVFVFENLCEKIEKQLANFWPLAWHCTTNQWVENKFIWNSHFQVNLLMHTYQMHCTCTVHSTKLLFFLFFVFVFILLDANFLQNNILIFSQQQSRARNIRDWPTFSHKKNVIFFSWRIRWHNISYSMLCYFVVSGAADVALHPPSLLLIPQFAVGHMLCRFVVLFPI